MLLLLPLLRRYVVCIRKILIAANLAVLRAIQRDERGGA
jgi:hypothetical protein